MFTADEREQIRAKLVSAAQQDRRIVGAAHLGSAALGREDAWSDIDLAFSLASNAEKEAVLADWTCRVYGEHDAVAHYDVRHGETLYRVFLLRNSLQIDISFWHAAEFRAIGPKFKLIFGVPNAPSAAPIPAASDLIGMSWLYALHVRSAIQRGELLKAEYMLSGMRNQMFSLVCLRCGVCALQGRGLDCLPEDVKRSLVGCFSSSLRADDLKRAFRMTTVALIEEIRRADKELGERLEPTLSELSR
ncbi:MAG: hypothetical protein JOZ43_06420 [Acidobacteriales bacterium]|nr:hypothetical protein [Terriglobales bacterium]